MLHISRDVRQGSGIGRAARRTQRSRHTHRHSQRHRKCVASFNPLFLTISTDNRNIETKQNKTNKITDKWVNK